MHCAAREGSAKTPGIAANLAIIAATSTPSLAFRVASGSRRCGNGHYAKAPESSHTNTLSISPLIYADCLLFKRNSLPAGFIAQPLSLH
jgi:hypothetical protein